MKKRLNILKKVNPGFTGSKLSLFLKVSLVLIVIIGLYGIYLDQKIRERIDGNVWQLPVAVYGQIVNLEPDAAYSKNDIVSILKGAQYRQVKIPNRPGEFVVNNKSIAIYRRPFHFPDGEESAFKVDITFANDHIARIYNMQTGRDFGFFRIDPRLITMMSSPNGEQRLFVSLKNFPDSLIKTLIETEDRRFYEHDGVSFISIARALVANFTVGKTVQGGSTLTQQLVKNIFLTNERSFVRKLREAYMAIILETRYSKSRILELYLNEVYLGQSDAGEIHGFPLASVYYFGRPVDELTLDQQALLVGIVKGASYYNPWTHPERVKERRNVVLKILEERGIIDEELYTLLSNRPLGVLPKGGVIAPQPAFIQLVQQELRSKLGNKINKMSGMKVFTTFDPVAQDAAEAAVVKQVAVLRKQKNKPNLEAAMVIVSRLTGEVKAITGSASPQYAGFNRALLAKRQIGSLAKPSTYLTALSDPNKYRLNTRVEDSPLRMELTNHVVWEPNNVDHKFMGNIMLIDAFAYSRNIPAIRLGIDIGFDATKKTLLALGVPKRAIHDVPSRYIGALELTPFEVAQMFQVIGNGGNRADLSVIRFVMAEDGSMIYQSYPKTMSVLSPQGSYLTLYAMQQAVDYGTGHALYRVYPLRHLAGKTGTTNDFKDSWFVGIDGKDVAVIWLGLDNYQTVNLTGSSGALTVYLQYLQRNAPQTLDPYIPPDIIAAPVTADGKLVCSRSGRHKNERMLPFWASSQDALCDQENEGIPGWLHQLFGGN